MRRFNAILLGLAVVAGIVAIYFVLKSDKHDTEPVWKPLTEIERRGTRRKRHRFEPPVAGGVYAGRVVDVEGKPIHGAEVLLVAYNPGTPGLRTTSIGDEDVAITEVGDYRVGGEGQTDAEGRFRIAADSQSHITQILAWHQRYFVDGAHSTGPRDDYEIVLKEGGRVVGTVVDNETNLPVAGARVEIFLQNKTNPVPVVPEGKSFVERRGKKMDLSPLAPLGRFIPKVLGPKIWDVPDHPALGGEALKVWTNRNGVFEIGPFGDSVQLEFVIDHPDYKWYDFDTDDGKKPARRTIVKPGETVRREFRMLKGQFVAGRVIDDEEKGVADVRVSAESISAYFRHHWYKWKRRWTKTDEEGRFRIDGLAIGDQSLTFHHPSFGKKIESVPAGTDELVVVVDPFGGLVGTASGLPTGRIARKVTVTFEAVEENPKLSRHTRRTVPLDPTNKFSVERITPGTYRVWIRSRKMTSQPKQIEIEPHKTTVETFEVGGGGSLGFVVGDIENRRIDPATVRLMRIAGSREERLGSYVTREGEVSVDGVAPGRYRVRVTASGFMPAASDPFEIREDRHTSLPAILLRRYGYLKFKTPVDDTGRPFTPSPDARATLEFRVGEKPWQPVHTMAYPVPVEPGRVTVRGKVSTGASFEESYEVGDGLTVDVQVVFR